MPTLKNSWFYRGHAWWRCPILLLITCLCTSDWAVTHAQNQSPSSTPVQYTVFSGGVQGYHTYRIPAIVRTKSGALLAFCEGRKAGRGDAGDIDVVLRRSEDDGETWSKVSLVWDDGVNTCGNPTPVVDQTTGTIWLLLTWNLGSDKEKQILAGASESPRHVYVCHSKDDGKSWTQPTRISDQVRLPHWRWYATGPGNGIQLERGSASGRLLIPANHSDHRNESMHPYHSHVFWSDDHGASWQLGGVEQEKTNESAVVELADGSLLHVMRSYHEQNQRALAVSQDQGNTWNDVYLEPDLPTPVCQASAIRFSWPEDESLGSKSRLLFSSPLGKKRENMHIWVSYDEGRSWPVRKQIYSGGAAYSNLVALPKGQVGLLYEQDNYARIVFTKVSISWLEAVE